MSRVWKTAVLVSLKDVCTQFIRSVHCLNVSSKVHFGAVNFEMSYCSPQV